MMCGLLRAKPTDRRHAAVVSRNLGAVTELTKTCSHCGSTYELPPDYVSGANRTFQTVHPMDRKTRRLTGQVIIIVAGVHVHECWQEPPDPRD